jgi:hypothetical protein
MEILQLQQEALAKNKQALMLLETHFAQQHRDRQELLQQLGLEFVLPESLFSVLYNLGVGAWVQEEERVYFHYEAQLSDLNNILNDILIEQEKSLLEEEENEVTYYPRATSPGF